ncbi:MAG: hypothetical protein IH840_07475 [Candidatus Heimdallarchaeota archaeon]|nr:hypothetical protein [Candidatus Heimdallarchaeota archaeon]
MSFSLIQFIIIIFLFKMIFFHSYSRGRYANSNTSNQRRYARNRPAAVATVPVRYDGPPSTVATSIQHDPSSSTADTSSKYSGKPSQVQPNKSRKFEVVSEPKPESKVDMSAKSAIPSVNSPSDVVFCVDCGLKLNSIYKFCPNCGQDNVATSS